MKYLHSALAAGGAMVCALVVIGPTSTSADEIPDEQRAGEWSEDGMMFGAIAVQGELVADATVPGGWALVRTIANTSGETQTTTVEERIMRSESVLDARVDGTPVVASVTTRTFELGPHEKKKLGIALPAELGHAMTNGRATQLAAERARGVPGMRAIYDRTYPVFFVQYLRPLAPGETASPPPGTVARAARMPAGGTLPPADGFDESLSLAARGPARGPK